MLLAGALQIIFNKGAVVVLPASTVFGLPVATVIEHRWRR